MVSITFSPGSEFDAKLNVRQNKHFVGYSGAGGLPEVKYKLVVALKLGIGSILLGWE